MTEWQEDARFVGAFIRGGSWAVGLRIARRVQPSKGGRPKNCPDLDSNRISLRDFADEAGVSTTTISTYLKVWEMAADQGLVDHAVDLDPDDEYNWETANLFDVDWKHYYRKVVEPKPAPKPQPPTPPKREPVERVADSDTPIDRPLSPPAVANAQLTDRQQGIVFEQAERHDYICDTEAMSIELLSRAERIAEFGAIGIDHWVHTIEKISSNITSAQILLMQSTVSSAS